MFLLLPVSKVSSIFDSQLSTCTCNCECPRKMIQNGHIFFGTIGNKISWNPKGPVWNFANLKRGKKSFSLPPPCNVVQLFGGGFRLFSSPKLPHIWGQWLNIILSLILILLFIIYCYTLLITFLRKELVIVKLLH